VLLMSSLRRVGALSPLEQRLLAAAWGRLFVVALALRWLGYRRVARWIPVCQERTTNRADHMKAELYARWIAVAARRQPLRAECLAQSLTLLIWLRAQNTPCALQIGVAKTETELKAHAWVEVGGAPVNDSPHVVSQFTTLSAARPMGTPTGTPSEGQHPTGAAALLH
jgi:hypothetical protein